MRHRIIFVLVLFVLALSIWYLYDLNQDLKRNQWRAELLAFHSREDEPGSAGRVRSTLDFARTHFGEAAPETRQTLAAAAEYHYRQGGLTEAVALQEECLQLVERYGGEELERLDGRCRLAEFYRRQGRRGDAERLLADEIRRWEKAQASDHPALVAPLLQLAGLQAEDGRLADAITTLQQAREIGRNLGETLPWARRREILLEMARLEARRRQDSRAVELYREALKMVPPAMPADDAALDLQQELIRFLLDARRADEAEALARESLTGAADHPAARIGLLRLRADCLQALDRPEEMLAVRETLLRELKSDRPVSDPLVRTAAREWAEATRSVGDYGSALLRLRGLLPENEADWASAQAALVEGLCELQLKLDRGEDAWELGLRLLEWQPRPAALDRLARVARIRQGLLPAGADTAGTWRGEWQLLDWRSRVGRPAENLRLARALLATCDPDDPRLLRLYGWLAEAEEAVGRMDEASQCYVRILQGPIERFREPGGCDTALLVRAEAFWQVRKDEELLRQCRERLRELRAELDRAAHPFWTESLAALLDRYEARGPGEVAEVVALRLLEAREAVFGSDHPQVQESLRRYAAICESLGRLDEAGRVSDRAVAAGERQLDRARRNLASALVHRARLAELRKRSAEARYSRERALTLLEELNIPDDPELRRLRSLLSAPAAQTVEVPLAPEPLQ